MTKSKGKAAATQADKVVNLAGDFRGAIINIDSTIVNAAAARDAESRPPEPGESPYLGLQHFDEDNADLFFGRELLTARIAGRLGQTRFLAVIGASGSGKSSLVRAGVIPALRRGRTLADGSPPPKDSGRWAIRVMTPTAHPLDALAAALLRDSESVSAVAALRQELAEQPQTLGVAARQALAREGCPHMLLVVDQFEETFSLCRQLPERQAFLDNLIAALEPADQSTLTVLIVLRADFYAQLSQHDALRRLISQEQEYIGAMSRDELFRAIVQPAALGDWKIQEGLVELMLDDVGDEPGALPLLSHALLETWARRRGRTMTLSAYQESGGVRGAIAKTAETIFRQRLTPEQQPVARMIFVRLTELGETTDGETPDTRRRAQFSELITRATDAQTLEAVIGILVDARLVTTGVVPPEGTQVVEVAHEALIREWPTLRDWLNQDREGLIRHRQLTEDVNDWQKLGRDPGALYRGARLEQTLTWVAGSPDPLSLAEQEFLEESRRVAGEETRREQRLARARRTQLILGGAAVLLLALVVAAGLYLSGVFREKKMTGDFNIAVAEFAVLDDQGRLTNDDHDGGLLLAERVGAGLQEEFAGEQAVQVWYDAPDALRKDYATIGVVGEGIEGATAPAEAAEALEADVIVYGRVEPRGRTAVQTLHFYLNPQFGLDPNALVGNFSFANPIPIFDPTRPQEEVWLRLDPLARALAHLTMGLRWEHLGNQELALQAFEQATAAAPDSDLAHYFAGQESFYLAQRGGEAATEYVDAAEASFSEALRLNPGNARARIGLGSVYSWRADELLDRIIGDDYDGDRVAALDSVRAQAQLALDTYRPVAVGPELGNVYGLPVNRIAQLGQGISLRVMGEAAFEAGDPQAAEDAIDEATETLEAALAPLLNTEDYRLRAQALQALGSVYEWKGFLLAQRQDPAARAVYEQALGYYQQCVEQGEQFPLDEYLTGRIVGQLCVPRIEIVRQVLGGES